MRMICGHESTTHTISVGTIVHTMDIIHIVFKRYMSLSEYTFTVRMRTSFGLVYFVGFV